METLSQLQQSLPPFVFDVLKLCVWLVLLIAIFVPLERLSPRNRQNILRQGILIDLAYYFLNGLLSKLLLILPLSVFAILLHQVAPNTFYSWVAELPISIRFPAAVVVGEVGAYWGHRWSHQTSLLWRFHSIHHSAEEIDWLVNTRVHPIDMAFARIAGLTPIYLLGLAQPTAQAVDSVPLLFVLFGTVWSFLIHANVDWRFGVFELMISTPAFHHWHHTKDGPEYINRNYAALLPWLDRVFGTYYLPTTEWPRKYGIDTDTSQTLGGQLLRPLSRRTGRSF